MKNRLSFIIFALVAFCAFTAYGQLGFKGFSEDQAATEDNSGSYEQTASWYASMIKGKVICSDELEVDVDGQFKTLDDGTSALLLDMSDTLTIQFSVPDSAFEVRAIIEYNVNDADDKGRIRLNNKTLPVEDALLCEDDGGYTEVKLEDFNRGMKNKNKLRIFTTSGSLEITNVSIKFKYRMPCYNENGVKIVLKSPDPTVTKLTPNLSLEWQGSESCDNGWIKIEYYDGSAWKPVPGAESIALGDAEWLEPLKGKYLWKNHGLTDFPKLRIVYNEGDSDKQKNAKELEKLANSLYKQRKYDEAIEKIDEVLELYPNEKKYLVARERIVAAKKKKRELERQSKALKLCEEAGALYDEEQYAEALEKIEEALNIDPDNSTFKKTKRTIIAAQKRTDAFQLYQDAEELFDNHKNKDALEKINQALRMFPDDPSYNLLKQRIRLAQEKQAEAETQAEAERLRREAEARAAEEKAKAEAEAKAAEEKARAEARAAEEERNKHDLSIPGKLAGERKTITVKGVEFAFRWCPSGMFTMGSSEVEGATPTHQVTLTKGFWMMETEVTVGMYRAFVNDTNYDYWIGEDDDRTSWLNPGFTQNNNHPVCCVRWDDSVAFCSWLNRQTGFSVQLPTEAQWEYACRAGTTGLYPGNLGEMAWYNEDYEKGSTHPVRTKMSNRWGLYDMLGNVSEWCRDNSHGEYPSWSVTDPIHKDESSCRIDRGGSFSANARWCNSAARPYDVCIPGDTGSNVIGFRCIIMPYEGIRF